MTTHFERLFWCWRSPGNRTSTCVAELALRRLAQCPSQTGRHRHQGGLRALFDSQASDGENEVATTQHRINDLPPYGAAASNGSRSGVR